jgi:hypothetical protein
MGEKAELHLELARDAYDALQAILHPELVETLVKKIETSLALCGKGPEALDRAGLKDRKEMLQDLDEVVTNNYVMIVRSAYYMLDPGRGMPAFAAKGRRLLDYGLGRLGITFDMINPGGTSTLPEIDERFKAVMESIKAARELPLPTRPGGEDQAPRILSIREKARQFRRLAN